MGNNNIMKFNSKTYKRHIEISRYKCADANCLPKDCPTLCGPYTGVETVAVVTHGKPKTSRGKTIVLDKNSDVMGNKGRGQNMVVFKEPHKTGLAQEHKKGTEFLNKGPDANERRKKVIDNENDHE